MEISQEEFIEQVMGKFYQISCSCCRNKTTAIKSYAPEGASMYAAGLITNIDLDPDAKVIGSHLESVSSADKGNNDAESV